MAYSDPGDKGTGDTYTEAMWDGLRANWLASGVATVTAKGSIAVATAANTFGDFTVGTDDAIIVAASGEATGVVWQNVPACRLYNSGNIDPATSSWVALTFDTETFDLNGMHAANASEITIPANCGGVYLFGACVTFDTSILAGGNHVFGARLIHESTTVIAQDFAYYVQQNYYDVTITISSLYSMAAGETMEVEVYASDDVNVLAQASFSPTFWGIWQRRQ
jgi:hypothetical protein